MRTLFLIFLGLGTTFAQTTYTFAPQAERIAKAYVNPVPKGMAVWGIAVQSATEQTFHPADLIIAAGKAGVILYAPQALSSLGHDVVTRTRSQMLADITEGVALGGAALTSGSIIKVKNNAQWTTGLVIFAGFAHWLTGKLAVHDPTLEKLRVLQLPADMHVLAGTTWTGITVGSAPKEEKPIVLQLP